MQNQQYGGGQRMNTGPRQNYQQNDRGRGGGQMGRGKPNMGQRGGFKGPNQNGTQGMGGKPQYVQQQNQAMPNPIMMQGGQNMPPDQAAMMRQQQQQQPTALMDINKLYAI